MKLHNAIIKRNFAVFISCVLLLGTLELAWSQDNDKDDKKDESDIAKRIRASADVLEEIMKAPDKGIPEEILKDAKCVVIVPSMVKFAIGVGGHYGKGVAVCRTANGWSAPAPIMTTGGSWGLQFGGEAVDLVMLIMNQKGIDHLLSSKFKIGADASAAAGPVGRHAEAGVDWKMKSEILTYSRARGIFAGIDLNGTVIKQDKDETHVLYGRMVPFETILHGKVPPPNDARPLLAVLDKYAPSGARQANKPKQLVTRPV